MADTDWERSAKRSLPAALQHLLWPTDQAVGAYNQVTLLHSTDELHSTKALCMYFHPRLSAEYRQLVPAINVSFAHCHTTTTMLLSNGRH